MSAVRGGARAWLLACVCSAACGDDDPGTIPVGSLDAGQRDGSISFPMDAGLVHADGSVEQPSDASTPLLFDATTAAALGCRIAEGPIEVSESSLDPLGPLGLGVRNGGATLSWSSFEAGKYRLSTRWFSATVGASDARDTPALAGDSAQTEPAVAATSTGYVSVWSDDARGSYNLRAWRTDAAGVALDGAPIDLTTDGSDDHDPAVAVGPDGKSVVVWQARVPSVQGKVLLLGADGKPSGTAHDIPGYGASIGRPAIARIGSGFVVAWVEATARHVRLQNLDATGTPTGSSVQVDADGDAHGNIDFAVSSQGGAISFDVLVDGARPEVHLRPLDQTGAPSGPEQIVTKFPDQGSQPALMALRGGYALAYRGGPTSVPQLRLALLDGRGGFIAATDVTPVESIALPLVLRGSPDGTRMFLGWLDAVAYAPTYKLQRAWILCD
ncbi:MAG: cell wall/surface repeat protein [Myxococcaceae bacterium]|nr:cell wall/surface repeat protein [Myxococcaceae bacterium]